MKVRLFLAVLPLISCGLHAASPAVDELPLAETVFPQLDPILKRAVQQSPRMVSQNLSLEMAENNRVQAQAGMLPYLAGYGRFLKSYDERADLPGETLDTDKIYYDVAITQPIFHWGERKNNARIGKINEQIAQGSYREAYRGLAMEIRATYLGLVLKKVYVQRCKFNVEFSRAQVRLAEDRLAKKTISEAQAALARLTAEQAELTYDRAEYDYQAAKGTFSRLTGSDELSDGQIPDSMPAVSYPVTTLDQLLAAYLAEKDPVNMEAVTLRYLKEVEKLNLANSKTRLLPKFNLTAGISQDEQSYTINTAQKYQLQSMYFGVGVSWTLFDGLASRAAVRSSLARNRQIENDYQQLLLRLGTQAQTSIKYINFSARNMSMSDRALVGAEGLLKSQQEEFKRGGIAESDVSLAELSVYDARLNAINSRTDYLYKVADFVGQFAEDPAIANLKLQ